MINTLYILLILFSLPKNPAGRLKHFSPIYQITRNILNYIETIPINGDVVTVVAFEA